jgi:hypothetical protein
MSATVTTTAAPIAARAAWGARPSDRRYYVGFSAGALLTVLVGFSRTYYLKELTDAAPLPPLVHLHGIVFTAWMLLFVAQTLLVAARPTRIHRRLGRAGGTLAALMLVVGFLTAVAGARRGFNPPAAGMPDAAAFLVVPIRDVLAFSICVGAGLFFRNRLDVHKRLMVLATVNMLPAAITRVPGMLASPALVPLAILAFVAAGPIHDFLSRRRMHPVNLWGGVLSFVTIALQFPVGRSAAWHHVARWIVG